MSRRILCKDCGAKWKPHPQDVREGWKYRAVHLSVKKPDEHVIKVIADGMQPVTHLMETILCDLCGNAVADGEIVLAVTMWRENPIGLWEHEYGTVLSEDAAKLVGVLEREKK